MKFKIKYEFIIVSILLFTIFLFFYSFSNDIFNFYKIKDSLNFKINNGKLYDNDMINKYNIIKSKYGNNANINYDNIPINNIVKTAYKFQHGNNNITKSLTKSEELYKIAAKNGSNNALVYLANLYHDGSENVKPNLSKALYYYSLAIKKGNYNCLLDMGNIYLWGMNEIKPNIDNAIKCYKLLNKYGSDDYKVLAKDKLNQMQDYQINENIHFHTNDIAHINNLFNSNNTYSDNLFNSNNTFSINGTYNMNGYHNNNSTQNEFNNIQLTSFKDLYEKNRDDIDKTIEERINNEINYKNYKNNHLNSRINRNLDNRINDLNNRINQGLDFEIITINDDFNILGNDNDNNVHNHNLNDFTQNIEPPINDNIIRNDHQNVHDHVVNKTVKKSLENLKNTTNITIGIPESLKNIRNLINSNNYDNEKIRDATKTLDTIETKNQKLSSMKMSELDALNLVWNRINDPKNSNNIDNLKDNLVNELAECNERIIGDTKSQVCSTGRFSRIIDTLNMCDYDNSVKIVPKNLLNQELMTKAAKIREDMLNNETENVKNALEVLEPDDNQKKICENFTNNFKEKLLDTYDEEYVKKGVISKEVLDSQVEKWINHI